MFRFVRVIVAVAAGLATHIVVMLSSTAFIPGFDAIPGIGVTAGFVAGLIAGRYVWRATANMLAGNTGAPTLGRAILLGALITGGIGFAGGFLGPMIVAPGANQGPMLGIFITGPAGIVIGAGFGALYWIVRRRDAVMR